MTQTSVGLGFLAECGPISLSQMSACETEIRNVIDHASRYQVSERHTAGVWQQGRPVFKNTHTNTHTHMHTHHPVELWVHYIIWTSGEINDGFCLNSGTLRAQSPDLSALWGSASENSTVINPTLCQWHFGSHSIDQRSYILCFLLYSTFHLGSSPFSFSLRR